MRKLLFFAIAITVFGCSNSQSRNTEGTGEMIEYRTLPLETITGGQATLNDYHGKVVLLVNVASRCGFTPQYEGLEALQQRFESQGFTVIGFPANNFMHQEPGTNEEILEFCRSTYDVTFPMMSKISVKGEDQSPLYRYLTTQSPFPGEITWNFNKFLLDREGNVIGRFGTREDPLDPDVIAQIQTALQE